MSKAFKICAMALGRRRGVTAHGNPRLQAPALTSTRMARRSTSPLIGSARAPQYPKMKRANAQARRRAASARHRRSPSSRTNDCLYVRAGRPPRRLRRLVGTLLNLEREARDVIAERIYALLRVACRSRRMPQRGHETGSVACWGILPAMGAMPSTLDSVALLTLPSFAAPRPAPGLGAGAVVQPPLGCESRNWWTSPIGT